MSIPAKVLLHFSGNESCLAAWFWQLKIIKFTQSRFYTGFVILAFEILSIYDFSNAILYIWKK